MPSKTLRGGANKTHARVSSTSSAGKLSLTGRTKSAEKIRRVDLTNHVARTPIHRADVTNGVGSRGHGNGGGGGGGDEDEWVSSESGAVTPAEEDQVPPPTHDPSVPSTTPRARPPPLPRVNTSSSSFHATAAAAAAALPASPDSLNPGDTPTSPTRRPPSVRNGRPHPLIRARSYAAAPALTDDNSAAPRPLRRQSSRASSLASVATMPLSLPFPTPTTTTATTPMTATATPPSVLSSPVHRARTLSAALSSLTAAAAALPHAQPPWRASSPPLTVAFPPPRGGGVGVGGGITTPHAMIPSPLAPPHAAATAHQNPFLEALQRVADAKARAGR